MLLYIYKITLWSAESSCCHFQYCFLHGKRLGMLDDRAVWGQNLSKSAWTAEQVNEHLFIQTFPLWSGDLWGFSGNGELLKQGGVWSTEQQQTPCSVHVPYAVQARNISQGKENKTRHQRHHLTTVTGVVWRFRYGRVWFFSCHIIF